MKSHGFAARVQSTAFTMVEVLSVVAILGVLASLGIVGITSWRDSVERTKLVSDVDTLNHAVKSYLAFNGSVQNCKTAEEVLSKLKSQAGPEAAKTILGLTGTFLDPRVQPIYFEENERREGELGVTWDAASSSFVIVKSGEGDIKGFRLLDGGDQMVVVDENRKAFLKLATEDTWIWDYIEATPVHYGPDSFPISSVPDSPPPPAKESELPDPKQPLAPPTFSIASTTLPFTSYNLSLTLGNPNPEHSSFVVYSVNYGGWLTYDDSVIDIGPDTIVQAQAIANDPDLYSNSSLVDESYEATSLQLLPPQIVTDADKFTSPDKEEIEASIQNPNDPGVSKIVFRVDGSSWRDYSGPFTLSLPNHPQGAVIEAQVVATAAYYEDSSVANKFIGPGPRPLDPPIIDFSAEYFTSDKSFPVSIIEVVLANPNPAGSSSISYEVFPVPGGTGPKTPYQDYSGPFNAYQSTYPSGFAVRAYAKALSSDFLDSDSVVRFATEQEGVFGGHLDLDTSNFLAQVAGGSTSAHTHDITGKFNLSEIDFFAIPDGKQLEITEAITNRSQKFKLILVNGDLSPGMRLVVEKEDGGYDQRLSVPANTYDDASVDSLPILSLDGVAGSGKLTGLKFRFDKDVILNAEIIPTNTGDVKDNELGKASEWRNGALTVQAVAVNENGTDNFTTDSSMSSGGHGAAASGLLWEAAVFWHWSGDSYHEEKNHYAPGQFDTIRNNVDPKFFFYNP